MDSKSLGYSQANDKVTEMKSMTSLMARSVKEGFVESYEVTSKGLHAQHADKYFGPDEVSVVNFYRFEGESDPGDNSILYLLEAGGLKGMLVDAYGAYADAKTSEFMKQVEDMQKTAVKTDKDQPGS